jgi:hypothetical protein
LLVGEVIYGMEVGFWIRLGHRIICYGWIP